MWRAKRPAAPCFLQMPPANKIDPSMEKRIQAQLRAKKGMLAIARDLKVGTGTVHNGGARPFRRRRGRVRRS